MTNIFWENKDNDIFKMDKYLNQYINMTLMIHLKYRETKILPVMLKYCWFH